MSESVQWRSQMPGASRVPPDLVLIWVQAASKGTVTSCFLSLQSLAEARGFSCRSGGNKITLLAAYFCNASYKVRGSF